ncbi:MAG: hypothetical protein ABI596_01465 [Pyrinomonadaceae bacterium]
MRILIVLGLLGAATRVLAQAPCPFDEPSMSFVGTAVEQSTCLLRPVLRGGQLGPPSQKLPRPLTDIVGRRVRIARADLRRYLAAHNIAEANLGGSLDEPLSSAKLPDGRIVPARYFIIHDVSTPNYLEKPFPANINDATWEWNDLQKRWSNTKVAHVFINRVGDSATAVEFGYPLPDKRFGTKFARDRLKESAKGLQLHVELVQPRRTDPAGKSGNDAIAPMPGFFEAQIDRLALIYVAASIRRGEWLIPAYHAAVDAGILNAHDDPQNFDLNLWAERLDALLKTLGKWSK